MIKPERSTLYIVATPIGNLGDISERAKQVLEEVDLVAAEDTRHSLKLLNHLELKKKLVSLHGHSHESEWKSIVEKIVGGSNVAYLTDAGTPGVSDPGAELVREAVSRGVRVVPIPGPSAVTTLLSVSGMNGAHMQFMGFFPRKSKDRNDFCQSFRVVSGVVVFFESPHRIKDCMHVLAEHWPEIPIVVGRELTKRYEEILHGTVKEVAKNFSQRAEVKGELCVALDMSKMGTDLNSEEEQTQTLAQLFAELHELGATQRVMVRVGKHLGLSKNRTYELGLGKK